MTRSETAPLASMGFTHIELMPIAEHPFDASWGYQPIGLYAPTSRFGSPQDFCLLIDACHRAGIGVIVDRVPGHFPDDDHGLAQFDGTAVYEHANAMQGRHLDWNTLIYNYGRCQFPARQCAVLAGPLPDRRLSRRCGRLDALSRLQPSGRRLDSQPLRRTGKSRGDRLPAPVQYRGVRALSQRHHPGGGIDRLAARLTPNRRRWARLRLQVEHGVDARHAAVHFQGAGPPQIPPQRRDLRHALCVVREFRPAPFA